MLRLAKAFWDIALWRRSPAQLPASLFLLALVAAAAVLLEVLSALLPPVSSDRMSGPNPAERGLAARLYLGGAGCGAPPAALSANRHRSAGSGSAGGTDSVSLGLADPGHRLGASGVVAHRGSDAGRVHLVHAGLRQYMARRAGFGLDAWGLRSAWAISCCRSRWSSDCCRMHDHACAYPGHRGHFHGRRGGNRQGRRISRDRLGSECVSAHEHSARGARHRFRAGLRRRAAGSAAGCRGGRQCA